MSQDKPADAYAAAGVDIDAAERLVSRIAELARGARRPEVLADVGPFSGLFRLGSYRDPVLVASTDSVGTKVKLAVLLERYEGLGHDLVNHCVNDALTAGAEPLFFLDYIGGSGVTDEAKLALVGGVAAACREAGCALLGGETADMPGLYASGDFDLVGFIVGVVERDAVIDGSRIREGDALLALPSNGLHTNGYSLVRKLFGVGMDPSRASGQADAAEERARLEQAYPELGGATLGEALLAPHRCYYHELKPLLVGAPLAAPSRSGALREAPLRGIAHITGGGIPGNVPRVLPDGLGARIDRAAWETPPLFRLIQARGNVAEEEMYRTFNMGIGIVLAVAPDDVEAVRARLPEALVVGEVVRGAGVVWG
ncbi:MAG: phosphoribosylformylglycinamidine cyclo-ligase [Dehalococcoidia bacterium]|nr:phosphoribosylformylglycinamidine cyclo-ligase [Dehalococcoidia bacterium]